MENLEFKELDGMDVFVFKGRITSDVCQEIEPSFKEKIETVNGLLRFDLQQVEYVSSSFIRLCILASRRVESGNFLLMHVTPEIKEIFTMVGLTQICD